MYIITSPFLYEKAFDKVFCWFTLAKPHVTLMCVYHILCTIYLFVHDLVYQTTGAHFTNMVNLSYIHHKVWDEIKNPFPYFNGGTVEVWEWISNFSPYVIMDVLLIHAGINIHIFVNGVPGNVDLISYVLVALEILGGREHTPMPVVTVQKLVTNVQVCQQRCSVNNTKDTWPGVTPSARVSKDVPPFRPPFVTSGTPYGWVFKCQIYSCWVILFHLESLSLGEICKIFISSHSLWVIFVKVWYSGWGKISSRGYYDTTIGVKIRPADPPPPPPPPLFFLFAPRRIKGLNTLKKSGDPFIKWFMHGCVITSIIKCVIKLLIHSQISTVASLTFWNGKVFPPRTLRYILRIHVGIKS